MKARPILFSGPMVRAILDGRKTQTRRIVKPQPYFDDRHGIYVWDKSKRHSVMANGSPTTEASLRRMLPRLSPCGKPGDVLWVRETFSEAPDVDHDSVGRVLYSADGERYGKCKPSIFMPRSYSRITLEIESIRVERLQDISEEDAIAEGVEPLHHGYFPYGLHTFMTSVVDEREVPAVCCKTARDSFLRLWDHINGRGASDANPWVWVIEYRAHLMNVDEFLKQREAA